MTSKSIKTVLLFANGNLAAFDNTGNQIPELQVSPIELWCRHAESLGYNPDGVVIEMAGRGKWRIFRTKDGGWNREPVR